MFGFSVLTAGIMAQSRRSYFVVCGLWLLLNLSFELLQANDMQKLLFHISGNHGRITGWPKWMQGYSLNGVFDFRDLLAIRLGAICAYCALLFTRGKEQRR